MADPILYSASQFVKLTGCEEQWVRMKGAEGPSLAATTAPMYKGTLLHTLMGAWWSGRDWRIAWIIALAEHLGVPHEEVGYEQHTLRGPIKERKGWEAPKFFLEVIPIMEAWEDLHGTHPDLDTAPGAVDGVDQRVPAEGLPGAKLVALELPFDLAIPGGRGDRVRGFLDGVVRFDDESGIPTRARHKLLEFKSMGRWGKDARVAWEIQLWLYLWAANQLFGVEAAVFEAISTYDYKGGDPARRFKRIEVRYDQRSVDRMLEDLRRMANRGRALLRNPGLAIRNTGEMCTYCDFHRECLRPWDL